MRAMFAPRPLIAVCALLCGALLASLAPGGPTQDPGSPAAADHAAWRERVLQDGRSLYLEDVSGSECIDCHLDVGEEWRHSQHALAWQDEVYQAELKKIRRKRSCWSCHIPGALAGTDRLQAPPHRSENRHLGIDCQACHIDEDGETILGPYGAETDAHPTRRSELFLASNGESTLCIGCHDETIGPVIGIARDYVETAQHELDHSCISCHMPGIRRPVANEEDGTRLEPRRARSHRIEGPRDPVFLREAFRFTTASEPDASVLRLENTTGHRVPGLVDRELRFTVRLLDGSGAELGSGELRFDHRSYLPVEEQVELRLPAGGARFEIEGWHRPPTLDEAVSFWKLSLEL